MGESQPLLDVTQPEAPASYDLVTAFDAIHDHRDQAGRD